MAYRNITVAFAIAALMATAPALCQETVTPEDESIRTIPAAIEPDARAVITGVNTFSLDLYRRTLTGNDGYPRSCA